jgi:hypothetical protein
VASSLPSTSDDRSAHDWVVEPGRFEVLVGASATDLRGRSELTWS